MADNLWWVGVTLGILASMSGTAGKQLMRFSELLRRRGTKAHLCIAKVMLAGGLGLNTVVGPLVDMGSYAFAPQSLIAPLGALDVVWNTLTAPCTLGERLTPMLCVGCALIGGGAVATSVVGSHDDKEYTLDVIEDTLVRWPVLIYLLLLCIWLAFNVLLLIPRSSAPKGEPWATGDPIRGLSLGMTAGSIAGNMFCVKAFAEVLQASIRDGSAESWKHVLPYGLFAGALFFAFSNLYFLTKALREYEALFMGAVYEGSLIIAACISGVVCFAELDNMHWWQIALYWIAVAGIVSGIFAVSAGAHHQRVSKVVVEVTEEESESWKSPTPVETASEDVNLQ